MCLFQLLEVQKHHQSTQTHINTQFWHPTWPCLIVNNTPISFSWIYLWPIFLTTQLNVKCSKIAKISKLKLWLCQKIIVKHLNPFKFSHCQQIPPLFFRSDSLTSYHLCYTRPMANVRLKVHSALPPPTMMTGGNGGCQWLVVVVVVIENSINFFFLFEPFPYT